MSCHNCYGDNTAQTEAKVSKALGRGFDLVELDLTLHADGKVYVEHNDGEIAHGTFDATLANASLQQSDRMLFLEVKETYSSPAFSDSLMRSVLRTVRDKGYAAAGRPVFLRAFMDGRHQHLVRAQALLATSEFAGIRDHIRLHTLIESDIRNNIRATKSLGFDGVELQYQTSDLFGKLEQARATWAGCRDIYTVPASMGRPLYRRCVKMWISSPLTTIWPPRPVVKCACVGAGEHLAGLSERRPPKRPIAELPPHQYGGLSLASSNTMPGLEWLSVTSDEDRIGGSMVFTGTQSVSTWDADNATDGGFLVTAVVNFDDLTSGRHGSEHRVQRRRRRFCTGASRNAAAGFWGACEWRLFLCHHPLIGFEQDQLLLHHRRVRRQRR